MSHIKHVTKRNPAQAESLLQWTQKATIFGGLATGLGTLTTAFNTYVLADQRKTTGHT